MDDSVILDVIAALLSGSEWDADTVNEVANLIRSTGRHVADIGEA